MANSKKRNLFQHSKSGYQEHLRDEGENDQAEYLDRQIKLSEQEMQEEEDAYYIQQELNKQKAKKSGGRKKFRETGYSIVQRRQIQAFVARQKAQQLQRSKSKSSSNTRGTTRD